MPDVPLFPFTSARHASRPRWLRAVRTAAVVGLGLLLVGAVAGGVLWRYAEHRIERRDIPGVGDEAAARDPSTAAGPRPLEGVLNILAVGTDSREGLSEQQLEELGTEPVEGERADSVTLVHLSPARDGPVMVALPRDLRVLIPGHGPGKLNAALAHGGPELLVETVESYTRVALDHYVQVDIAGFLRLTDILGGVPVCLEEPLVDRDAGADLVAGEQVLTGTDAAAYVRARKSDPRGDLGRIERQQTFVRQAMRQVLSAGTLANPVRVKRLVDAAGEAILTDAGLGGAKMVRVGWSLRDLDPASVEMRTIPATPEEVDGTEYLVADPEPTEAIFQALRSGEPLPEAPDAGAPPPGPAPSEVGVEVRNGAGRSGLAAAGADLLAAEGFRVLGTGNVDGFGIERTQVRYAPGRERAADLVAAHFRSAEVTEDGGVPEDVDVVVALGEDWARDPTLVETAATAPPDSPTSSEHEGICG